MKQQHTHSMKHFRTIDAPLEVLYELVADVTRWPVIFGPSVYVRHLERSPSEERFQLWALVNNEVKSWTSRRVLDAAKRTITFTQERSQAPLTSMYGEWRFLPTTNGRTGVTLEHHFSVTDDKRSINLIARAVDRNSEQELAALAGIAELNCAVDEVVYTFEDTVWFRGDSADAYTFIHRSDLWPTRLPHVNRVLLREERQGVQDMEMDTVTADGGTHTTRSVRICLPNERIVYKQLLPPAMLFGHSGSWEFGDGPEGVSVTARHTVAINPAAAREVLGAGSTLADARSYLREALGGNSRATLAYAREYVNGRETVTPGDGGPA